MDITRFAVKLFIFFSIWIPLIYLFISDTSHMHTVFHFLAIYSPLLQKSSTQVHSTPLVQFSKSLSQMWEAICCVHFIPPFPKWHPIAPGASPHLYVRDKSISRSTCDRNWRVGEEKIYYGVWTNVTSHVWVIFFNNCEGGMMWACQSNS